MRIVRGIAWVMLVLLAALAFALTGWVPLLATAVAALLLPLAGWVAVLFAARGITASLVSATTAQKDEPVVVSLVIENASRMPVVHARASLKACNLLTGEQDAIAATASVPPRGSVEVPLDLTSVYCGRVSCSLEYVCLFEMLRIFSRKIPCEAERRFTVMPTLYDVQLRDVYAASPLSDTTVFSPYVKGNDLSELFALREYEEGDELKRIHWKLSEKIDQMIVRDASLPLDNALLLFWDKGIEPNAMDAAQRADAMADVVLALMEQLARADVSFEVASNDILQSSCPRTFVTDENDIYEVIGQLLSSPVAVASNTGIDEYRRFYGSLSCSRLIYVCAQRPAELEGYLGMSQALLLICDGTEEMRVQPQVSEVHFPSNGASLALEMAGAM